MKPAEDSTTNINFAIDIGNSLTKMAVFSGTEIISFSSTEKLTLNILSQLISSIKGIRNIIISSVAEETKEYQEMITWLKKKYIVIILNEFTPLPVKNFYATPHTLGKDRIACACGATVIFPNLPVLAIDAGTCITYNFVNEKNQFLGGGISPGIDMRFKSLYHFTARLPLLSYNASFDKLIGQTTEESILSGVLNGVSAEIHGTILNYKKLYDNLNIIITGGYMKFVEKILKNSRHAYSEDINFLAEPFLVLKGLNRILNYNLNLT